MGPHVDSGCAFLAGVVYVMLRSAPCIIWAMSVSTAVSAVDFDPLVKGLSVSLLHCKYHFPFGIEQILGKIFH